MVTSTFKFASGVHGTGTWSFSAYDKSDVTEIVGNKGKISFSPFGTEPVKLTTGKGVDEFALFIRSILPSL